MRRTLHATGCTQGHAAFTLIEVMIALGVSVLLIVVSTLYLAGYRSNQHVDIQAGKLAALMQSAQGKSASQENNARWGVFINNPAGAPATFALYQVNENLFSVGEPFAIAPGIVFEQLNLPAGVTFTDPVLNGQTNVVFARGTGLPLVATNVSLQAGSIQSTIYADANGRIEYR